MSNEKYAVFILSHGRADDVKTIKMLQGGHYSGKWFVVIDDEDKDADKYFQKYGDHVIQFCKKEIADQTDTCDLDNDRRVGVFARNFIIDEAKRRGYKYHLQLDDDFTILDYRFIKGNRLVAKKCTQFDALFAAMLEFLENTNTVWLSFGLNSWYQGGAKNKHFYDGLIRKTMGSFFMNTDLAPKFFCRMNDDITTNIMSTYRGSIMFTFLPIQVLTPPTQHVAGGMTDIYQENGTYRKSFYSIMNAPSFVLISSQGIIDKRLHHEINWNACAPKILNERYKKNV
jgi:hypothetical protein